MKIRLLTLAFVAFAMLVIPSAASAANYCVGDSPDCTGSPHATWPVEGASITAAISEATAHAGDDNVYLAAGEYTIDKDTFDRNWNPGADKLNVIGAGEGETVFNLVASDQVQQMMVNFPNSDCRISGFTLNVTVNQNFQTGMFLRGGTAGDFAVNLTAGASPPSYSTILEVVGGSSIDHAKLTSSVGGSQPLGILVDGPTSVGIDDVSISGPGVDDSYGIKWFSNPTTSISRLKMSGYKTGIWAVDGTLNLSDSVIDLGNAANATGVLLKKTGGVSNAINATLKRDTIVGSGDDQVGVDGFTTSTNTLGMWLEDSAAYSSGSGFIGSRCVGGGTQAFLTQFAYSGGLSGCIDWEGTTTVHLTGSPFRSLATGDLRPAWNSQLVDNGSTTGELSGGALDAGLDPRAVDGDGNGSATVDIGAYEYQRGTPGVAIETSKSTLALHESATFTATGSDPDGETLTYAWTVDGSPALQNDQTLSIGFVAAGVHTVAVTVTDEAGLSAGATVVVTVKGGEIFCPAILWGLSLKSKPKQPFSRTGRGFASPKKGQPYFALAIARGVQRVRFTLQSISKSKKLKTVKGSQVLSVKAGTKKFGFGGRFGGKKLKPGKYKVTATPQSDGSCPPTRRAAVTIKLK